MDTIASDKITTRRRYSADFKAQVLDECDAPGASVAKVAMSHGINTNVVHGWRKLAREAGAAGPVSSREFVPVALPAAPMKTVAERGIEVELRRLDARAVAVIRIDAVWPAIAPLDMRAGTESALALVVNFFGAARPHHAYLFANRRANRMMVLVHDGIGVWLAARRLNQGRFAWPREGASTLTLTRAQLDALVLGLPWARIGEAGVITVL